MNYVTYGGVTIGLCLLARQLMGWYPGIKSLRGSPVSAVAGLAPFFAGWAYGCLTTLGVGGVLGWISGTILGISNWLGDVALTLGVGSAWSQTSSGVYKPLSPSGLGVLLILTAVFLAALRKDRYSSDLKMGAWCGICLGTSAGVSGVAAAPLANAANWIGQAVYGAL